MDSKFFQNLLVETLRDPQRAAGRLIGLNPAFEVRVMAFVLIVVLSALLAWITQILMPVPAGQGGGPLGLFHALPLHLAALQFGAMATIALALAFVGQRFGGKGSFADALLLTVWLEAVMLMVQVLQIILSGLFPLFGLLVGFASFALFFWLLTNFAARLHGFTSLPKVFFGVLVTMFAVSIVLAMLLPLFGVALIPAES